MSHDLDDALRSALRHHAEDAPTSIDTDAIRLRAKGIQRRRAFESVAAVVVLLGVVLGLGALVGTLRNDAIPPPVTTQTPVPGSGPMMAFTASKDGNSPIAIVLRSGGTDTWITPPVPGPLTVLGWYGPDHRTLVWANGMVGFRETTLYAVTVDAAGRPSDTPHPLKVPGLPDLTAGRAFATSGGPLQFWMPTTVGDPRSPATLMTIDADLTRARTRPLPAGPVPVVITADAIAMTSLERGTVSAGSLVGTGEPTLTPTSSCTPRSTAQATPDESAFAVGCPDGSIDLVTLPGGSVTHLGVVPDSAEPGALLGLWFDPVGVLHASAAPVVNENYSVVHDYDLAGRVWVRSADDSVLTRIYPAGSASVRLVKENDLPGNLGRWIVESSPEVDLGPTGGSLVVAPVIAPTPTASPPDTALGATATVRGSGVAGTPGSEQVWVRIDGRDELVEDAGNAATSVLGWYGPDHRTLVWQTGQDLLQLRSVTFGVDGSMEGTPRDLEVSGVVSPLEGVATAIPGDGLVLWHQKPGTRPFAYEMVRLDEALALHSRTPDSGGGLVFATGTAYATVETGIVPTEGMLVTTAAGTNRIRLAQNCDGELAGVPSLDGNRVALTCSSSPKFGTHVEIYDLQTLEAHDTVLPTGFRLLWWDTAGALHASVDRQVTEPATAGPTTRWVLTQDGWRDDPGQTADLRVFPVTGPSLRWTREGAAETGSWTAETDPEIAVGPGLPSPVYEIGTGNIAVRPNS